MLNFVSNSKNPYAKQSQKEKTDCLNGKFIPKKQRLELFIYLQIILLI